MSIYRKLQQCFWDIKAVYDDRLMWDLTEDRLVDKIRVFLIHWNDQDGRMKPVDPARLFKEADPLIIPAFQLRSSLLSSLSNRQHG